MKSINMKLEDEKNIPMILASVEDTDDPEINEEVTSRLQDLVVVLEKNERFTNFNEYNARGRDLDGIVGGRSVDLLNDDSD